MESLWLYVQNLFKRELRATFKVLSFAIVASFLSQTILLLPQTYLPYWAKQKPWTSQKAENDHLLLEPAFWSSLLLPRTTFPRTISVSRGIFMPFKDSVPCPRAMKAFGVVETPTHPQMIMSCLSFPLYSCSSHWHGRLCGFDQSCFLPQTSPKVLVNTYRWMFPYPLNHPSHNTSP